MEKTNYKNILQEFMESSKRIDDSMKFHKVVITGNKIDIRHYYNRQEYILFLHDANNESISINLGNYDDAVNFINKIKSKTFYIFDDFVFEAEHGFVKLSAPNSTKLYLLLHEDLDDIIKYINLFHLN